MWPSLHGGERLNLVGNELCSTVREKSDVAGESRVASLEWEFETGAPLWSNIQPASKIARNTHTHRTGAALSSSH